MHLTAPAGRGSVYLYESPRLETEPRLAGAVQTDFFTQTRKRGNSSPQGSPKLTHAAKTDKPATGHSDCSILTVAGSSWCGSAKLPGRLTRLTPGGRWRFRRTWSCGGYRRPTSPTRGRF